MNTDGEQQSLTPRQVVITGGAGFIGSNLAARLLGRPQTRVTVFDDLSRSGVSQNIEWLCTQFSDQRFTFVHGDVRDRSAVESVICNKTEIYHLAAQVAVTTSLRDPQNDFDINLAGTMNVLEAARKSGNQPFLFYTSTNKVYGGLSDVPVEVFRDRYVARDSSFRGVTESMTLDFYSPYGCSKGAADQYVRDYSRMYSIPSVVFRMSCIAGPRQFGTEDQGWVAHFLYSVLEGNPITIYGDGYQVRDILHVEDLLDAIEATWSRSHRTAGQIYNCGGGPERAMSVREMLDVIHVETGLPPDIRFSKARPGDQPLYTSNTSKLTDDTGWTPTRSVRETIQCLSRFWKDNEGLIASARSQPHFNRFMAEEVV